MKKLFNLIAVGIFGVLLLLAFPEAKAIDDDEKAGPRDGLAGTAEGCTDPGNCPQGDNLGHSPSRSLTDEQPGKAQLLLGDEKRQGKVAPGSGVGEKPTPSP